MNVSVRPETRLLTGVSALVVLAAGQLLSAVGTRMTNFALAVYVYNETGSATQLTTMSMCALLATAVFSPLAGALVDRWRRRTTIMVSDAGSLVVTAALLALFATGQIQVWELFVANVLTGALMAFQLPAYISTVSMIVDRRNYPRASAIFSITRSAPAVIAPGVAAPVLSSIGMKAILAIDGLSYAVAVATVFLVAFPVVEPKLRKGFQELLREMAFGFRYIWNRPAMRGLETVQFLTILLSGFGAVLITPFILDRTGSVDEVGLVSSIGAVGGIVGAVLLSVMKPTSRKAVRMLAATMVFGLVGRALFGFADSVAVWSFAWLTTWFCLPFINSYGHSIWQEKVDPQVQGRVFATRQLVEGIGIPIAVGLAGPLADTVFEPQMRPGHLLGDVFGGVLGTTPGSGVALMYVLTGALLAVLAVVGLALRSVRDIESAVPDFVAEQEPAKVAEKTEV
ncbi:MFS transporter [Kutzneria sp. CA-103260]|uniref:MFS transporter n=1 Tax=Kutzneria sp. CA-103260 TaxID=2802641 RepID=UPI001BA56B47|nr:MFS transporter [Kutzneria sp. CA-103260]QUQ67039.1 non-ribosomal peptide synthetase/polyketide synthase [Kutzneria sp. CA-103260]